MSVAKRKSYIENDGSVITNETFDEITDVQMPVGKLSADGSSTFVGLGFEIGAPTNESYGKVVQTVAFKSENATHSLLNNEPHGDAFSDYSYAYASGIRSNAWKSSPKVSYSVVKEGKGGAKEYTECSHVYNHNEIPPVVGPISAYFKTETQTENVLVARNYGPVSYFDAYDNMYYVQVMGNINKVIYDDGLEDIIDTSVSGNIFHEFSGEGVHSALLYTTTSVIMPGAFSAIPKLYRLEFSPYITKIANSGCVKSHGLQTVYLGNNIKYLGEKAFSGDYTISQINLENVEVIRDYCFAGAFSENGGRGIDIDISFGHLKAATKAAFHVSNVGEIILPETLETLGESCFESSIIRNFTICGAAPITEIPKKCFKGCSHLIGFNANVNLNNIEKFGDSSFHGTSALTPDFQLMKKLKYIGSSAFFSSSVETFTTTTNLLEIGSGAFYQSDIHTFTMGQNNKLKKIHSHAFSGTNISSFTRTQKLVLIGESAFCQCSLLTDFIIPKTLWGLRDHAFYNTPLNVIQFEDNCVLEDIGDDAFAYCNNATSLNFGANSALQRIGNGAFQFDTNLTGTIYFSKPLIIIEDAAFYNCIHITALDFPARDNDTPGPSPYMVGCLRQIGERAFCDCFDLTTVYLRQEKKAIPGLTCTWKLPVFDNAEVPSYYADRCFYGGDNNSGFKIHVRDGLKNAWGYGNGLLYYRLLGKIIDDL